MTLEEAIEQTIKHSRSLYEAKQTLFNMFEAKIIRDKHYYYVHPYIVRGHNRRRRRRFKLIRRAS